MSKIQIGLVGLGAKARQTLSLPSSALLLDVRMVEGVPHLAYAFDPDIDEVRNREIVAMKVGEAHEVPADHGFSYIPTNWRVDGGLTRYFEDYEDFERLPLDDPMQPAVEPDAEPDAEPAAEPEPVPATEEQVTPPTTPPAADPDVPDAKPES